MEEPMEGLMKGTAPAPVVAVVEPTTAQPTSWPPTWLVEAEGEWVRRLGGVPPRNRLREHLQGLEELATWPEVRAALRGYLTAEKPVFADPRKFAETFGVWAGRVPLPLSQKAAARRANLVAGLAGAAGVFDAAAPPMLLEPEREAS
jgi:hypothetical protein